MDYETILQDSSIPASVRYAMIRTEVCKNAKNRADKRHLLMEVGTFLEGTLVKGHPNYWVFKDGRKAKFQS